VTASIALAVFARFTIGLILVVLAVRLFRAQRAARRTHVAAGNLNLATHLRQPLDAGEQASKAGRKRTLLLRRVALCALGMAVLLAAAALSGCGPNPERLPGRPAPQWLAEDVRVWHDDARHVTCWIASDQNGIGLSCLPDSALPAEAP
jgi:hypothetical protein